METHNCDYRISINTERLEEFVAIHFDIPKEMQNWFMWGEKTMQFLLPIEFFDRRKKREGKNYKWLLSRTDALRANIHYVFRKEYLEAYKSGETMREMFHDSSAEQEQFLLAPEAQDRIYRYCDDGWLRKGDEVLLRDIWIEAWPTRYGNPKNIEAQARKHPTCLDVDIQPNPVWQNHDISGRSQVFIKVRLTKEQTETYLSKEGSYERDRWLLEDLLQIERIPEKEYY